MKKILFVILSLISEVYCSDMNLIIENNTNSTISFSNEPFVYSMLTLINNSVPKEEDEFSKIELSPGERERLCIFVDSSVCGKTIKDETMKMKISDNKEVALRWGLNYSADRSPLVPYIEEHSSTKSVLVFLKESNAYLIKVIAN